MNCIDVILEQTIGKGNINQKKPRLLYDVWMYILVNVVRNTELSFSFLLVSSMKLKILQYSNGEYVEYCSST